jgi:protein phosphatase
MIELASGAMADKLEQNLSHLDTSGGKIASAGVSMDDSFLEAANGLTSDAAWTRTSLPVILHWIDEEPSADIHECSKRIPSLKAPFFVRQHEDRWQVGFHDSRAQRWPEFLAKRFEGRKPSFEECRPFIQSVFRLFKEVQDAGLIIGDFDDECLRVREPEPSKFDLELLLVRSFLPPDPTSGNAIPSTRAFDAPEFRSGQADLCSSASDVFVIGSWMIALLTGRPCFAELEEVVYLSHQLRALCPDVPYTLHPWLGRSCAIDSADRYKNVAEQHAEFERLLARYSVRSTHPQPRLRLGLGSSSRMGIGKLREEDDFRSPNEVNEDRTFAQWSRENEGSAIVLVAEGVTNCVYGSGARAAEIVRSEIERAWLAGNLVSREALRSTMLECNVKVVKEAVAIAEQEGANLATVSSSELMGATVAVCLVLEHETVVATCGDARAYLWCVEDGLVLLSYDTNQLNSSLRTGEKWSQAQRRDDGATLASYIGLNESRSGQPAAADPEIWIESIILRPGDAVLLCSDGLTDYLGTLKEGKAAWNAEAVLAARLAREPRVRALVEQLADEANRNGGGDNITVAMLRAQDVERAPLNSTVFGRRSTGAPKE